MPVKTVRVSTREALSIIRELTDGLSGRTINNVHQAFWSGLTYAFMEAIHDAFMTCSAGRTDRYGRKWKPLSRHTIAYHKPITLAEKQDKGLTGGKKYRGLLNRQQDALWRGIFKSTYLRLVKNGVSEAAAAQQAGQRAWAVLKARGAPTKIGLFGKRKVPILITTGALEKSLRPGVLTKYAYRPPQHQIAEASTRGLRLGTEIPYADRVHKVRPILPNITLLVQREGKRAIDFALNRVLELI